jgi:hypothetical protein
MILNYSNLKIGDKFKCVKSVDNIFDYPLFIKENIYEILYFDEQTDSIVLNHILYACEYAEFNKKFIEDNFDII